MASAPVSNDQVELTETVEVTDSSLVKQGLSFAERAGGGAVKPLTNNNDEKGEINKDIKDITNVSNIVEKAKNVSIINSIREFYRQYCVCYVEYNKEVKEKHISDTFRDYFIKYLKSNCNTGSKYLPYKKVEKSFIIYPNDLEKDSLGSFKFDRDNLQIMDFNNVIPVEEKEFDESNQEIFLIEQSYDGASIILSVNNGNYYIRTTKTFDAKGKFDDSKSHKERFIDICKENNINLEPFIEYSKTTPDKTYCLHIIMNVNHSPFPKSHPNSLVLSKAYLINDKSDNLSTFNTKLSQIILPELSPEEKSGGLEKLFELIKTELSFDYIYEKDVSEMISFLTNIRFGTLLKKTTYSFDPTISFIDQKDAMLKVLPYEVKGITVWDTMFKKFEFVNPNYEYVESLRLRNIPMNVSFEKDGSLSKFCEKRMFILFLHIIYNMDKQRSTFGRSIKPDHTFSNQFYRYYDKETIEVDSVSIGKYSHILKNIIRVKVGDWFKHLYETYMKYVRDLNEIKHKKKKDPSYRKQLSFPPCFLYYDYEATFVNSNDIKVTGIKTNFIKYIHDHIFKPNKTKDMRYRVTKEDIEMYITKNVFIKYYKEVITNGNNKDYSFTFESLHNLILNPIKEVRASYYPSKPSIDDI